MGDLCSIKLELPSPRKLASRRLQKRSCEGGEVEIRIRRAALLSSPLSVLVPTARVS